MRSQPFFSKRIPLLGNVAMLMLCLIFFVLPFVIRGARQAVDTMENKVADWLPADFPETTELRWFREHFVGDQFVVISWDGCYENDSRFIKLVRKLKEESVEEQEKQWAKLDSLPDRERNQLREQILARKKADELALHTTGSYHTNWSANNVKWLMGEDRQWYFINRKGELFRWKNQDNIIFAANLAIQQFFEAPVPQGKFIAQFGSEENNQYYKHPERLHARFFKSVKTGPEIFDQIVETMKLGDYGDDDLATLNVKIEAHKRLTGLLFGPTPRPEFDWTWRSLKQVIPEGTLNQLPDSDEEVFVTFVEELVKQEYDNEFHRLLSATQDEKLEHWYRLWSRLQPDAPPRQTCIVVSLNEPVIRELYRAVGRPMLGKPRGRILELASFEAGIVPSNLRLGGPPVDNVAIDEEGSITLFRLASLSGIIGISLAWLCFRSIKVTLMLFFIGVMAAFASLAIVYYSGFTMDAILMTMPSLVYVLGMSSAVHVLNYYRDSCHEFGETGAPERAFRLGWFPCTLAAFTTALGLISLYTSNLTPIKYFGLFSAIATLATILFLFTYLPSALTIWKPGYEQEDAPSAGPPRFSVLVIVRRFWAAVCELVIRYNKAVAVVGIVTMVFFALGIARIETSIQLLKLFRSDAKILKDYRWMEANLGKLVPMELVINVNSSMLAENVLAESDNPRNELSDQEMLDYQRRLSMLERMELSNRVRKRVLEVFGSGGLDIIGSVMSADIAIDLDSAVSTQERGALNRIVIDGNLTDNKDKIFQQDYLAIEQVNLDGQPVSPDAESAELWRISLRLAALNNVDYGDFVNDLKAVVEPILAAYRYRNEIVRKLQASLGTESLERGQILVLGPDPRREDVVADRRMQLAKQRETQDVTPQDLIDQTALFSTTLFDLLQNAGYTTDAKSQKKFTWLDPLFYERNNQEFPAERFQEVVAQVDCVVLVENHPNFDASLIKSNAPNFVDATGHQFLLDKYRQPLPEVLTARQLRDQDHPDTQVFAAYTGIVPIVYKAQRALLQSLIRSIGLAFVMIAVVMMILLRNWRDRVSFRNLLNLRGGLLAMIPNVFPIVIIFGAMGHLGILVDIGSMMTASVAMGVAVDDTIHFLNWFRKGIADGKNRLDAIRLAFDRCASAMTQTTLIAGLGLSAFAFSTFMPTQRFGVLMLVLLATALIGDLIVLPALLAGPLGKHFGKQRPGGPSSDVAVNGPNELTIHGGNGKETPRPIVISNPLIRGEAAQQERRKSD